MGAFPVNGLPDGFVLDAPTAPAPAVVALPEGFVLDASPDSAPLPPPRPAGVGEVPDWDDPANPDYSRRHGGSVVTAITDAIGSALTLPGDVVTGKFDLAADVNEKGVLGRVADMASIVVPRPVGGGPRLAPSVTPSAGREAATAASRLDIDLPRAVASDSGAVQALGSGLRNVPFAGEPLMRAAEGSIRGLGEAAGRVATEYGGTAVPAAGAAAREALAVGWKGRTAANQERLYGRVDELVDPSRATPLEGTRGVVSDILARRAASRVDDPGGAVAFVSEAIKDANGLTYEGIKNLRTMLGEKLKDTNALAAQGVSQQELNAIYGGLSNDLRSAVSSAGGPKALEAFNAANAYSAGVKSRADRLKSITGAASDEGVFERIVAAAGGKGQRADIDLLSKTRRSIGPEAWDDVAGAVVGRLGRDAEGQFSPQRFITDFGKLSPEGKAILFNSTGRGDLSRALTDIATVSSRFKELQKYANPSGSGRQIGFTGGAYGLGVDPLTIIGATVGGNVLARVLAQPASASSLAKWTQAFERVATTPGPGPEAALSRATQNLSANIGGPAGGLLTMETINLARRELERRELEASLTAP